VYEFDRTFAIGSPFSGFIFSGKQLRSSDLVHIYESLTATECDSLCTLVAAAQCWVRISPKVGHVFEEMAWIGNLRGCSKLWLDLSAECRITISDIELIDEGTRELLLPFRPGVFYRECSFRNREKLELLGISGTLSDLGFLEGLTGLRELRLFRVKLASFIGLSKLPMLSALQVERSTIGSTAGLRDALNMTALIILDSRISGLANFGECEALERLELAKVVCAGGMTIPSAKLKCLRLVSVKPQPSLEEAWKCEKLEILSNDKGASELASGYMPIAHPTLELLYVGPLERSEAKSLSRKLGVQVVEIENEMPFAFI